MSPRVALVYEHVAFDLDGTLVDSRADLAGAVNHVLRTLGLSERPPETLYGYVGEGARMLVERSLGAAHVDRLDVALALFMERYAAHLLDATRPYPGIVEVLVNGVAVLSDGRPTGALPGRALRRTLRGTTFT